MLALFLTLAHFIITYYAPCYCLLSFFIFSSLFTQNIRCVFFSLYSRASERLCKWCVFGFYRHCCVCMYIRPTLVCVFTVHMFTATKNFALPLIGLSNPECSKPNAIIRIANVMSLPFFTLFRCEFFEKRMNLHFYFQNYVHFICCQVEIEVNLSTNHIIWVAKRWNRIQLNGTGGLWQLSNCLVIEIMAQYKNK